MSKKRELAGRRLRGDADVSTVPDLGNANGGNDVSHCERTAVGALIFSKQKERRSTMKLSPSAFQLYAITAPAADLTDQVRAAIAGGITMLQIREKNCTTQRLIQLAYPIVSICRNAGIPCIINDDVEAARVLGADGVHVGQRDMKLKKAREILGVDAVLGTSAHSVEEAIRAEQEGADYIGCGAVFPTGTKSDTSHLSFDTLCAIRKAVSIPVIAIGGINTQNLPQIYGSGINGIAVVSAIFGEPDVQQAARTLRQMTEAFQEMECTQ